jgi:hypothetical protein
MEKKQNYIKGVGTILFNLGRLGRSEEREERAFQTVGSKGLGLLVTPITVIPKIISML